ncbi:MAG: hypothetical protein ACI80V_000599 [Rhodothermales bacterium]|jgi:hypothetical protein
MSIRVPGRGGPCSRLDDLRPGRAGLRWDERERRAEDGTEGRGRGRGGQSLGHLSVFEDGRAGRSLELFCLSQADRGMDVSANYFGVGSTHGNPKHMKHVLQFKITLRGIKPPIWRRVVVPEEYSFWSLHVAFQSAMDGWLDYHLHLFSVRHPYTRKQAQIGVPDEYGDDFLPGWEIPITSYFGLNQRKAVYEYDFGDGWLHDVRLEAIMPVDKGETYPQCIGGRRQCPPEDCGGIGGYAEFLAGISDPQHPEHESYLAWLGAPFDPEAFDPSKVIFDDPDRRWRFAFLEDQGGVSEDDMVLPTRNRRP